MVLARRLTGGAMRLGTGKSTAVLMQVCGTLSQPHMRGKKKPAHLFECNNYIGTDCKLLITFG
jgi:hypothetical protein